MKLLLPIILSLGLVSCSQQKPQVKPASFQQYFVTFAAVKIPNDMVKQHGGSVSTNGYDFTTLEARYEFAAYILAHTNEFSFTACAGNFIPMVGNNQQANVRLILDPSQEDRDFERFGMKTTQFDPGINVQEEDDIGNVGCSWSCNYEVHLKEPIGNSTDQGGGGALGGMRLTVGKPDITPLIQVKGVTLWELVKLSRK